MNWANFAAWIRTAPARVLTYLAVIISATSAQASPWGQAQGDIFVVSRIDYFLAKDDLVRFERMDSNTYVEIGLPYDFTVGGKVLYGRSWFNEEFGRSSASGISELEGFVQKTVYEGDWDVFSLRLAGAKPAELDTGVRPEFAGIGPDVEARALYGKTFRDHPLKVFAGGEVAYRKRFSEGADQARADFTLGVEPTQKFLFLLDVYTIFSLRNEDPGGGDFDVVKIQPSAVYRVGRWGIQAGVNHETAGRNILEGTTYFLGLRARF